MKATVVELLRQAQAISDLPHAVSYHIDRALFYAIDHEASKDWAAQHNVGMKYAAHTSKRQRPRKDQ